MFTRNRLNWNKALAKYPTLSKDEVKTLVVDDKWLGSIAATIHGEIDRISQTLTQRLKAMWFDGHKAAVVVDTDSQLVTAVNCDSAEPTGRCFSRSAET